MFGHYQQNYPQNNYNMNQFAPNYPQNYMQGGFNHNYPPNCNWIPNPYGYNGQMMPQSNWQNNMNFAPQQAPYPPYF